MNKPQIRIKKIGVKKFDLPKDSIDLFIDYEFDAVPGQIQRDFLVESNMVNFIVRMAKEIKDSVKANSPEIAIEFERGEDNARNKIADAMDKILLKVNELKKTKDAVQYMKLFHEVNNLQIGFK